MGSDARIGQLSGLRPSSCLSWLRSHKGCQNNVMIYSREKIVEVQDYE